MPSRSRRVIPIADYCLTCGEGREACSRLLRCQGCKGTIFVPSLEFVKFADMLRLFDRRFLKALKIASTL